MGIYEFLQEQHILNLFLILGLGLLVGKIRIAGVELGSVTGVLFAGLIAGHLGLPIPSASHNIGFVLFIYCVGVQAGPRFVGAFRRDGGNYVVLSVVTAVSATLLAYLFARALDFDAGVAAGMLSGALTSTPTLVAAQDALNQGLPLPDGVKTEDVLGHLSTSYAITYVFGMAGLILFVSFLPKMLRIDVADEAAQLGEQDWVKRGGDPDDFLKITERPSIRAYRVEHEKGVGRAYREIDRSLPGDVQRIKRGSEVFVPDNDTVLERGDIVAVVGVQSIHKLAQERLGPEVVDYDVLDRSVESRAVIVANKEVEGRTLSEMNFAKDYQCWLTQLTRSGVPISRRPDLELRIGDILVFTGARSQIEKLAERLGHLERRLEETDLVTFAFGIALGILFGIPSFKLGATPVGLGTAGGVLLSGLILGLLHSSRPRFGRLPSPARYILMELGLLLFMAHIAVSAGGTIVDAFKDVGPTLALCGVAVTIVPVVVCFLVGRFVLRMNAALLLGAVTGSMTSTAALQQVSAQANSTLPTLGYVGTYAFANVLLAVAGGLIMRV